MHIYVTDHDGVERELEALEGWRVMEVIRDWGLDIKADCGGACSCATCHVFIEDGWFDKLEPASDEEEDMLDLVPDTEANSRLSCQIITNEALDGLKVRLALSSKKT